MLTGIIPLADTQAYVVDATNAIRLTIITGAGATATISRVNSGNAAAHTTGAENAVTVAASSRLVIDVDWPYYRVSVAGGPCRIALI